MKFTKKHMIELVASRLELPVSRVTHHFNKLEGGWLINKTIGGNRARVLCVRDMAVLIVSLLTAPTTDLVIRRTHHFCLLQDSRGNSLIEYFVGLMLSNDVDTMTMMFEQENSRARFYGYAHTVEFGYGGGMYKVKSIGLHMQAHLNGYALKEIMLRYLEYHPELKLQALAVPS